MSRSPVALVGLVVTLALVAAPAAGAQTPKRGGTLVYAQPTPEQTCLNLLLDRCIPGQSWLSLTRIWNLVLERPYDFGPQLERRPRLVARVEYTRKPPYMLTFHIRPEARWSDRVPVTARDFIFTLRVRRRHDPQFRRNHTSIRSIRAVDAKTVRVVLRPRYGDWKSYFVNVLPSHAFRGVDPATAWIDRIDNPRTGAPIGSGPFLVERWERGEQVVLRRNPNYWGPRPAHLDRLILRFGVGRDSMLDAIRRGVPQISWGFPYDAVTEVRRAPGIRVHSIPGTLKDFLHIRVGAGGHPALGDKRVRRALAYGIDRAAIARAVYGQVDPRVRSLDSAIYLSGDRRYRPNWSGYRLRREASRRLLERAGCTRGADDIYSCAGRRLSLRLYAVAGVPTRARTVELATAQLRRVGIEVLPTFLPSPALFDPSSPVNTGDFDLAVLGWVVDLRSEADLAHDLFGCGLAPGGHCQRLVTRDLDQARRILDPEQQARVLNRADVQLAKDVPALPLHQGQLVAATGPTVRGFVLSPSPTQLIDAENWWLDH